MWVKPIKEFFFIFTVANNPKPSIFELFIVSTRDIEAGEELVADYTLYTFNK